MANLKPPVLMYDVKRDRWILQEDYTYRTQTGVPIEIPKGYKTDLASVPRFFWRIIGPHELSEAAPLVHDWLYKTRGRIHTPIADIKYNRLQADEIFLEIMEREGVPKWRRHLAYNMVRMWGYWAWRK